MYLICLTQSCLWVFKGFTLLEREGKPLVCFTDVCDQEDQKQNKKRVKVGAQKNKCRRKGKLVAVIWQRRGLRGGSEEEREEKKRSQNGSLCWF